MDHYADDLAAVTAHLDLKNAIHVGHSTGGGEVVHYLARHGESRVAKAAIISRGAAADAEDAGQSRMGCRRRCSTILQAQLAASRSKFYYDLPAGPFYGFNRPGVKASDAVIWNWWRQGMMGGAKAHYDGIVAFSQTDFTEDLKKITRAGAGDAQRRRPDRALCRCRTAVGKAAEERHAENLQGFSARHADDAGGDHQRGPAGFHQRLELLG